MSTPVRLGESFLFSGYAKLNDRNLVEPEAQALSPVRDLVLFTSDPSREAKADALTAWKTDQKGLLFPLADAGNQRPTAIHCLGNQRRFQVPPPAVLLQAWAADRDKWAQTLAGLLAQKGGGAPGVVLTQLAVRKRHLRPPDRADASAAEQAWAAFYDKLSDGSRLSGFVLAKTRALFLRFASEVFDKKEITLVPPEKKPVLRVTVDGHGAIVIGTPETLPSGLYTIRVPVPQADRKTWSAAVAADGHFELRESVRFGITNFAGDFDIVNCDPISVEEAVMLQFPTLYGHRAAAAKKRTDYPELELEAEYKDFPKALEQWSERVSWAQSKAKFTVGLINADGNDKRARSIGKAVWGVIEPKNELLKSAKGSIDLAFGVHEAIGSWGDIVKELRAENELAGVKKLLWSDLNGSLERRRWWKYVKSEYVDGDKAKILSLGSATEAERASILKAGIPQKRTTLQELVGDGPGGALQKGLLAAGLAIDVYKAALAFNDVLDKRKSRADLESDFASLLAQVDSVLARAASREGIGNLERLRTATVAADLKVDEQAAAALMAAVDVVLGALTLVGVGGAALGAVVLAKEVAGLGKDVVVDATEWLDRLAFKGMFNDLYARQWAQMSELARTSASNQSLMGGVVANGGADDLHLQFRLRAEALHGLVGLLTRASVASKDATEYAERIRKYRVGEYLEHFVLGDRWQYPIRPLVPIGMDAAWLYLTGPFAAAKTELAVREQFGLSKPLRSAAVGSFPLAMSMLTVVDSLMAGNVIANYQRTFPVHRTESALDDLAGAFRTAWRELGPDCVEYTCVYRRPRESTDASAWQPVNAKGSRSVEELEILSPLDHVRILVVLKKEVAAGIYPVSFQLFRTDGLNLSGPVYRDITRRLGAEDLLASEQQYAGRIGCLFHPFFQVGQQVVPGIKPLAHASAVGVGLYHLLGYLGDMRYAFKLRLGDGAHGDWLKLGAPNGGSSDLDELRVGIRGRPDEERLLVADFLERESEKFEYPTLFEMRRGFGPVYVRVGGGPYRLAAAEDGATLKFDDFDWKKPVEFVVVGWASKLACGDWDVQQLDWSRVPVEMELANLVGLDDTGPSYASTLSYLGELFTASPSVAPGAKAPDGALAEWLKQVRGSPAELKKLVDAVDPHNFGSVAEKSDRYHLFAASFSLDYDTPGGVRVKSLRPFGDVLTGNEHYRIAVRNVRAAKGCGLDQEALLAPVSASWVSAAGYSRPEYQFHFKAPAAGDAGLPWAGVSPARLKKWIEDESAKRNPNVALFAKDE